MKRLWRYLPVLPALFCLPLIHAQSAVDVNVGFGTASDSVSGVGIDTGTGAACPTNSSSSACQSFSSLGGFFLGFGGDIMFREHFGAGAEVNFQPTRHDYGPFLARQSFVDVNGIYEPLVTKRAIVQFQGGIGSATTSFAVSQSSCASTAFCSTSTSSLGSSTHFQVHVGAGLQIGLTSHLFIRPQFDLHFVPGLTDQFGRTTVPEATVWIGYHFGEK